MPNDSRLRPVEAAVFRELETGGVILNVETGEYYELNASGRYLWRQLEENGRTEEMSAALVSTYGIDADTARADVEEFVAELERRRLITTS